MRSISDNLEIFFFSVKGTVHCFLCQGLRSRASLFGDLGRMGFGCCIALHAILPGNKA